MRELLNHMFVSEVPWVSLSVQFPERFCPLLHRSFHLWISKHFPKRQPPQSLFTSQKTERWHDLHKIYPPFFFQHAYVCLER